MRNRGWVGRGEGGGVGKGWVIWWCDLVGVRLVYGDDMGEDWAGLGLV